MKSPGKTYCCNQRRGSSFLFVSSSIGSGCGYGLTGLRPVCTVYIRTCILIFIYMYLYTYILVFFPALKVFHWSSKDLRLVS